jgi:hypothetical protein
MRRWQESYLNSSDHPLVRCMPSDTPVLAPGGAIGYERG